MDREKALAEAISSLQQGAELRVKTAQVCGGVIVDMAVLVAECFRAGGKVILFGNGGSAADAQHLAAEFVGRFVRERQALPAIALTTDSSILTAVGNDYGFDEVFARQIEALGRPGDVAIGISTSGNSPNVVKAMVQAKRKRMRTIGWANAEGGALAKCVELAIKVPSTNVARVQESHIAIGHILCELVERDLCKE